MVHTKAFWLGADVVVEVVSPDDPERDTKLKRADYAEARIPEYWILNLLQRQLEVFRRPIDDPAAAFGLAMRKNTFSKRARVLHCVTSPMQSFKWLI